MMAFDTNNTITAAQQQHQQQVIQNDANSNEHDSAGYESNDDLCSNSSHLMQMQTSASSSSQQQQQQQQFPIVNRCNEAALAVLLQRTGYPLAQENGQRKYGPPPNWSTTIPNRGCEVFVGKIPRDCFEDELVPVFEKIGPIYELRLMMDFNGYNRGYAFVMFETREQAKKAVREMNNFELRKNKFIGVCSSVDNCRLFVGGIPKNKKKEEILEEIKKVTDYVKDVIVYPTAHDKSKNRGFAFVEYANHKAAAMARRKLLPGRIQLWGHQIAVDWAEPETEVDEEIMAGVKILYVRNLMLSTTEEYIKAEFEKYKKGSVERVKKLKDYAFIHFKEREDAVHALNMSNGTLIDGSLVEVTFAKPVDKTHIRMTRGVMTPTSQYAGVGLAPTQLIPGALHLAANTIPMQFAPSHLSLLQSQLSPSGNQRMTTLLPGHPGQYGGPTPASPEFLYDLYPGIELPMMPLNQMPMKYPLAKQQQPWQILEDLCAKQGLGTPVFTLHTTDGRDMEGREVGLYLYKVSIPALMNGTPIAPKLLSCSVDEAKNNAAENVLIQLGMPPMTVSQMSFSEFYNQTTNIPPQSQAASIYQGRPLSTAHGVNLSNGQTPSPANSIPASTNNAAAVSAAANATNVASTQQQTNGNTANRQQQQQNAQMVLPPDFVPLMTPYYYDPTTQYLVSCGMPPPPPPNAW